MYARCVSDSDSINKFCCRKRTTSLPQLQINIRVFRNTYLVYTVHCKLGGLFLSHGMLIHYTFYSGDVYPSHMLMSTMSMYPMHSTCLLSCELYIKR